VTVVQPIQHKTDLLKISPFPTEAYQTYPLTSLTAYCVYWLQHWNITTSLENLAVASHRMFPVKFAMVGWPEFPDLTRMNRSVLQMRPKYRNLATSSPIKGVFLNKNGLTEAESLTTKFGPPFISGKAAPQAPAIRAERGGRARSVHPEDLLSVVRQSQLFRLYHESRFPEAEAIHLVGLLSVYDHTPSAEKRRELEEFQDAAKEMNDEEVTTFLSLVAERFKKYLNR
jgi:hypothetical protein